MKGSINMQVNSTTNNNYAQSAAANSNSQIASLKSQKQELESQKSEVQSNSSLDSNTKQTQISTLDAQISLIDSQISQLQAEASKAASNSGQNNQIAKEVQTTSNGDEVRDGVIVSSSLKEKIEESHSMDANADKNDEDKEKQNREDSLKQVYTFNQVYSYHKTSEE